eukprot:1320780-Amorphochlora_amoeboformis.AAC.1
MRWWFGSYPQPPCRKWNTERRQNGSGQVCGCDVWARVKVLPAAIPVFQQSVYLELDSKFLWGVSGYGLGNRDLSSRPYGERFGSRHHRRHAAGHASSGSKGTRLHRSRGKWCGERLSTVAASIHGHRGENHHTLRGSNDALLGMSMRGSGRLLRRERLISGSSGHECVLGGGRSGLAKARENFANIAFRFNG